MEKQFNIKLLSKKTGTKNFSSFRKSHNHLQNLLGLFSPESPLRLLLNWLYEVIIWNSVSGSHLNSSWLSSITKKYQSLSNQSFYILTHVPSIYLTTTLSCEPRFRMFIINGYYTKSKCLQSLFFLLKDAIIYCVFFD